MGELLDPYYQWLGIPPKDQPPHHYRLLGLELFEANPAVIENAADQRMAHVRTFQIGRHAEWSQRILNELAAAKICLLNPEKKAAYDHALQQLLAASLPVASPVTTPAASPVASPVPVVVTTSDLLAERLVVRRRRSSWLVALGITILVVCCGVALALMMSQDSPQAHRPKAKPRRPVIDETVDTPTQSDAESQTSPVARNTETVGESLSPDRQDSFPTSRMRRLQTQAKLPAEPLTNPEEPTESQSVPSTSPPGDMRPPEVVDVSPVLPASPRTPPLSVGMGEQTPKAALARGLKWLAANQHPDGSWSFQTEPNPGCSPQTMAATAMALLPFLRTDNTHETGEYRKQVGRGLEYLCTRGQLRPAGMDLRGSNVEYGMYAQALATIALCQAYLQTKDRKLRNHAQLAVNFIVEAQDPKGGGWRYEPRQRGDTSVLGWQMTALASAREAKLKVPQVTLARAALYLNSVQSENGRAYGYEAPGRGTPAMTAIGLLSRAWLGWDRNTPALRDGVQAIVAQGPSDDVYFNFYATRLLAIWGQAANASPEDRQQWIAWKEQLQPRILNSQELTGNAEGSWFMGSGLVNKYAGRLGVTSLTLIILTLTAAD